MAGTVGVDALRADNMDTTANVGGIGGGAGAGTEPDIYYQGVGAVSRKVTAAGFFTDTGATRDVTATGRDTWLVKVAVANFAGATSLEVRYGSAATAYYTYTIFSAAGDYPAAAGGFLLVPINSNIAGYRDNTTGSPTMTAADYFGVYMTGPTSKAENLVLDAVDLVYGLYVTAGTVGSPATFTDFLDYDEGTIGNRYGVISSREGVLFTLGQLVIGATTASGTRTTTATVFNSSDDAIVFPDGRFAAGWSGITVDIGNASTDVDFVRCNISSRGNITTTDTRADLTVVGTSGTFDANSCSFLNFRNITLTSACTLLDCNIGLVDLTQSSADISGCTITVDTASGVAACNDVTFGTTSGLRDCTFVQGGSGHALEITTAGDYTLTDLGFSGFGADTTNSAAIYVSAGTGTVNLTISGGDTPTVRSAGATVNIIAGAVTVSTLTVDTTGTAIENVRVHIEARDGTGPFPFNESVSITRSGTTATVTHTAHGMATNDKVVIRGCTQNEYNGVRQITVTNANTYTFTVAGSPATPATGSPVSTFVALNGLTDANGEISVSRVYSSDQPVVGRARKSTNVPHYKTADIIGTIGQTTGISVTAVMVGDD